MVSGALNGISDLNILQQAEAARRQGNPLLLLDLVQEARAASRADRRLDYLEVLALAQMGQTARAEVAYSRYGLSEVRDEDTLALRGRLLKDAALAAPACEAERLFAEASRAYQTAYDQLGGSFAAINAASTAWAAGDKNRARALAGQVLRDLEKTPPADFFACATRVEALVLLDRADELEAALSAALAQQPALGEQAIAHRQLRWLARGSQPPPLAVVAAERLQPPPVVAYCGHMFRETETESAIAARIGSVLDDCGTRSLFGGLACGADILFAEAALARGCELHVTLPFDAESFLAQSVRPGGPGWEDRFNHCLAKASSTRVATRMGYTGEDEQYAQGSIVAFGGARLRAAQLEADVLQIAMWDGLPSEGIAGTGADVRRWRALGLRTLVLSPDGANRALDRRAEPQRLLGATRAMRAVLFADFAGFSRLKEETLPRFWAEVMGKVASVVERHACAVEARNTWGDALFAVIRGPRNAAAIALEIVEALDGTVLDPEHVGGGMRIGLHHGSMFSDLDPVTGQRSFYGSEVTLAARIEPRVPTGQVYVTEAFASALAMEAGNALTCRYVGRLNLPKDYGTISAYRLERGPSER